MLASLPPHSRDVSDSFPEPTSRRRFLAQASALSLAIPGVGTALTACSVADAREVLRDWLGVRNLPTKRLRIVP